MIRPTQERFIMQTLQNQNVIVTGGSSGLGLGLVHALVERNARVTVVARDAAHLAELKRELDVDVEAGDIADRALAERLLRDLRPAVVVLNAGAAPKMAPIHEQTWEAFNAVWDSDVKAGLYWIQEAIRLPLPRGSRVLIGSSGAAVGGSPLSGGYAGAKRMLWFMAHYANGVAAELDLGIRFQVVVPLQIVGETKLGRHAAEGYARRRGITLEAFLAGFGKPMSPRQFGEHVVTILTDPMHQNTTAFGLRGDTGITSLDGAAT
jgi:NAD(P)-dependent dehydrogenase (short-subunit alcohol dehydrogenase family)